MSAQFDRVAADAMKLPLRERVRLAQQLVSTLDDQSETEVEQLWLNEAQRRLDELTAVKSKESMPKTRLGRCAKISRDDTHLPS